MPNWKAPGKDGVQGYWLKNLTLMPSCIAVQLNHILQGEGSLPDWMILERQYCAKKIPQRAVQLIIKDQYPASVLSI